MYPSRLALAGAVILSAVVLARGEAPHMVMAKIRVDSQWKSYPTRSLEDLQGDATNKVDSGLSRYGGLLSRKVNATGFFYPTNLAGRWWLVDPEGCLFLDKGVTAVQPFHGTGSDQLLKQKFGAETDWASQTADFLRANGFNNLGAWSATDTIRAVPHPLVYTRVLNFMSSYGEHRGGVYQQPGHAGYPNDCIFVFDPDFEAFCDNQAKQLTQFKDDPWLLGYFSDNEMPLWRSALKNYLKLPATEAGFQAAQKWLRTRHGDNATTNDITADDEKDFLAVVVDRYYRIVSTAIKKYDPNHLYIGSRFNGKVVNLPEVFHAAGPYVDVVSVNYYDVWTPLQKQLDMWTQESGRPVLITEWYTKGEDSGMANKGGAGWIVKTQGDRGQFYQNFTLALLQSKDCVGWDWFKYADNDPTDTKADPSNRDANKGIVDIHYQPYAPLLDAMKELNVRAYSLIQYFDAQTGESSGKASARL
ncbi:MAG TPA: hypothetical protein VK742_19090 [Candidatus Sulfotelmatobacter sp.]|jgi:hypothetical protein|nr:hypothetical protein [Candidatus Sulfotelmatobacter sp.]